MSLKNSLYRIIISSILLTTVLILIAIWNITSNQVNRQLNKDLSIAQEVFTQVSNNRQQQLLNSANVLTSEFAFKKAMATGDVPTIQSVLNNHGQRIDADMMLLIDLNGEIITHYPEINLPNNIYPNLDLVPLLIQQGSLDEVRIFEDKLFQIILLPIKAPSLVGIAGIAFEYDTATLNDLKRIISGDIIITSEKSGVERVLVSTINPDNLVVDDMLSSPKYWLKGLLENTPLYYTRNIALPQASQSKVHIKLAQNITPVYREMIYTLLVLVAISSIVMLLTISVSIVFSRKISRPFLSLVDLADKIAKGDYEYGKGFTAKLIEIEELTNALFKMRDNIKVRERKIQFNANHDVITSLNNRFYLEKALSDNFESEQAFQIIGLSLKGFRNVNNLYGFVNGDKCLVELANRLNELPGIKCRISGGTFCVMSDKSLNLIEIKHLQANLEKPIKFSTFSVQIRFAIAVIDILPKEDCIESVFRKLNIVLEGSKKSKTSISFYDPEQEKQYLRRLEIISELKNALDSKDNELFLVYQPKLDLNTGEITGAEALIRWISPKLGFVPPDEFISIAEQAGMIEAVTTFVMKQSIHDLLFFKQQGLDLVLALNLSTQDIENPDLLSLFKALLEKNQLNPNNFQLEVTESDLVADASTAIEHLNQLQADGFTIAIDDFGTGYSSLAYLKNLPINTIKIDRCFVMELTNNTDDQTLVKSVLQLAKSFELSVVAEGIEDANALDLLQNWGCDYAQGYYIAKPLEKEKVIEFMTQTKYQGTIL